MGKKPDETSNLPAASITLPSLLASVGNVFQGEIVAETPGPAGTHIITVRLDATQPIELTVSYTPAPANADYAKSGKKKAGKGKATVILPVPDAVVVKGI